MNGAATVEADQEACLAIIREGSRSFHFASLVLPREVRRSAIALYAFCRVADDLVDAPGARTDATNLLRQRIAAAYDGRPFDHPADRAFARTVELHGIPDTVPLSLIEGFEWDMAGRAYRNLGDVLDYAARVAGTVGVMMSLIMGRRSRRTLARACDLGVAMQLVNIARDVGEDARNGRCYLPEDWLAKEGLSAAQLIAEPAFGAGIANVVERLLDEADRIAVRARTGIGDLPRACRPGVRAAALVYGAIGTQVRANGCNSIDHRAHTSASQKLSLLVRALANPLEPNVCDDAPALAEVDYLVRDAANPGEDPRSAGERFAELIARLEQRDRSAMWQSDVQGGTPPPWRRAQVSEGTASAG